MELTKELRNQIYMLMLDFLINDKSEQFNKTTYICEGLCVYLALSTCRFTTIDMSIGDVNDLCNINNYPELLIHKPKDPSWITCYWFKLDKAGKQKRIKILKQAIKDTELQNNIADETN